jgi:hypothetical protein
MDGMEKMLSNNMGTNNLGNMLSNLKRKWNNECKNKIK